MKSQHSQRLQITWQDFVLTLTASMPLRIALIRARACGDTSLLPPATCDDTPWQLLNSLTWLTTIVYLLKFLGPSLVLLAC